MFTESNSMSYSRRSANRVVIVLALSALIVPLLWVWSVAPALALAIAIPVASFALWKLVFAPSYGVSFGKELIKVTSKKGAACVPVDKVAYLRLVSPVQHRPAAFVMRDGKEIELPDLVLPTDMDHLRNMASQSGVIVRAA